MGKIMYTVVRNEYMNELDFEAASQFMDDDLREELHGSLPGYYTDQEFFDEYCRRHKEKFGEEFFLAEENPVW